MTRKIRVIDPSTGNPKTIAVQAESDEQARRIIAKQGLELYTEPAPVPAPKPRNAEPSVQLVRLDPESIRALKSAIGWQVFMALLVFSVLAFFVALALSY